MYDRLAETYALDPELRQWLERVNPWALQSIAQRLLEAAQRGMWAASAEMLERLQQVYLGVDALLEGREENRSLT
jgi:cobaltochelatase CobN